MSETQNKRVPLMLFSGGIDSTQMLYDYLKNEGDCEVIYVAARCHDLKIKAEIDRVEKILDYLRKPKVAATLKGRVLKTHNVKMDVISSQRDRFIGGLEMPLDFIYGAMQIIDPNTHSSLAIAYIKGDCAIIALDKITKLYDMSFELCKNLNGVCQHVPIWFPSVFRDKQNNLEDLPQEIQKLCWVCETPVIKGNKQKIHACGNCKPCLKLKKEELFFDWKKENGIP